MVAPISKLYLAKWLKRSLLTIGRHNLNQTSNERRIPSQLDITIDLFPDGRDVGGLEAELCHLT